LKIEKNPLKAPLSGGNKFLLVQVLREEPNLGLSEDEQELISAADEPGLAANEQGIFKGFYAVYKSDASQ
jgi:hypothetical protein